MKRIKDESESEKWEKRRGESWWQQSQARPLEISLTGHACPTLPCASFLYQLVNLIIFFHPHPFTIFPTFSKSFPIYLIYFFIPPPDLPKKSAALRGGGRGGFGVKKLISAIPPYLPLLSDSFLRYHFYVKGKVWQKRAFYGWNRVIRSKFSADRQTESHNFVTLLPRQDLICINEIGRNRCQRTKHNGLIR